MNDFYCDAIMFLKKSEEKIISQIEGEDALLAMLLFALGLERIFKGILYDLNPIFTLVGDSFKDSAIILYKEKMLENYKKSSEINHKANGDLIAYRKALQRARLFSKTVNKHSSLFYEICQYRDILAHCEVKKININKVRDILNRDFINVVQGFAEELNLKELTSYISQSRLNELNDQSNVIKVDQKLDELINNKLKTHLNIWESRRNNQEKIDYAYHKTSSLIGTKSKHYMYDSFTCPACNNKAILTFEYDNDILSDDENAEFEFVTELNCYYCDLNISDFQEIDYLELEQDYYEVFEMRNYKLENF